jgi:hypothetical protein
MALTKSQKILSDQIDWEIENIIPVLTGNEWLSNKEIRELKIIILFVRIDVRQNRVWRDRLR